MQNRVEKLRIYLLGSAVFLVLVIGAYIGLARYLRHRFLVKLPARLGINIVRETNAYTYCQTVQGRTVYCIHAAKAIERTDGKVALHDVSITLYGQKGDRSDHIYGDEFEYDQNAGLVRATGVVHIDLLAANGAGSVPSAAASSKVMHVTTSGLVYLQKLGVAATSEPIEFQSGTMTGHAVGADYASDSGIMMLHSAVTMNGFASGLPVTLTAATAEFDDRNQVGFLTHATYTAEGRNAAAEQATLHRRQDGTLSRVEAHGNVTMQAKGATVVSQKADVALNAKSQPETALLTDRVRYSADEPLRQMRGESDVATIAFDKEANPQPQHAVFTGRVHMTERTRATEAAKEPWSTRDLTAAKLDAALAAVVPGRPELRDAEATGNPKLTIVNSGSLTSSNGAGTTELSADDLKAHLIAAADPKQLSQLDTIVGRGHTVLRQMSVDGMEQVSTGDALDAKIRPKTAAGGAKGIAATASARQDIADVLESAVQQGHVTMMRRAPAKGGRVAGGDDVEHATAQRAVYDGDADRMTLTGGVQVADAGSALWANQVALDHKTGDAHALGSVKMNFVQDTSTRNPNHDGGTVINGAPAMGSQSAEPTHILADRADLDHATDISTFYGKPVRLWQGADQVQAPVIEFSRAQRRLIARGEAGTGWSAATQAAQVHTVLAGAGSGDAPGSGATGTGAAKAGPPGCASSAAGKAGAGSTGTAVVGAPQVVRVASGGLVYSDILRQADFTGGFRADTVDGTIRAGAGTVVLEPAKAGGAQSPTHDGKTVMNGVPAGAGPSLAGSLDRVIATGHVELDKPGLRATGERLVYTASDRVALLTGDEKAPPKAVDAQGTTTGAALRFQSSCDGSGGGSVEAIAAPGQPVQTDAQVSNDGKKEKGKR